MVATGQCFNWDLNLSSPLGHSQIPNIQALDLARGTLDWSSVRQHSTYNRHYTFHVDSLITRSLCTHTSCACHIFFGCHYHVTKAINLVHCQQCLWIPGNHGKRRNGIEKPPWLPILYKHLHKSRHVAEVWISFLHLPRFQWILTHYYIIQHCCAMLYIIVHVMLSIH